MNKLFTKIGVAFVGIAMAVGVGVAVGNNLDETKAVKVMAETADDTWDLTSSSDDFTSSNCETYFTQPYGMKKADAYIQTNPVSDFSLSGISSIKIGVKCLQNGGSTSRLTVYLLDKDDGVVATSSTITPDNYNAASKTTWKYVTFSSSLTSATGFRVKCTTYGKNILINGANYEVTYQGSSASYTTTALAISGSIAGTYNTNTSSFDNSGFTVTRTKVNNNDNTDIVNEEVTSGVTYHWEYTSNSSTVTLPISDADTYSVKIWAEVEGETLTTKDNATQASKYVTGNLVIAEPPAIIEVYNTDVDSPNGLGGTYGEKDWAANGCEGKIFAMKCTTAANNTGSHYSMQMKKDERSTNKGCSYIYNTKAIPGYITSITLTKGGSSSIKNFKIWVDDEPITDAPSTGGTANSTTWEWTFNASDHYNYFYILNVDSGTAYLDHISVSYDKITLVDPTGITLDDDSSMSMDTYGYGRRLLKATVEPFNNNNDTVTWGSNDESVATVEDGVVTPVGVGDTTIYCHTANYDDKNPVTALIKTVAVHVSQATYKKAKFVLTRSNNTTVLSSQDDYLQSGSASFSTSGGSWDSDHKGIGLAVGNGLEFTISGYKGMKIDGIDIEVSSKGTAGGASLSVTAGSTTILSIAGAKFSDATWNGVYSSYTCNLYRATTEYVLDDNEDVVFSFAGFENTFYVTSVAIRYLDYSLEQWCEKFMNSITCTGATQQYPNGAIIDDSDWDDLGLEFLGLDQDLIDIAAKATANKDSTSVIEQAMARYDLILRKYGIGTGTGQHDDFIGRFGVGKVNGPLNSLHLFENNDNSNAMIITIVISIVGAATVGGYFFLRKKKEQ